MSWKNIMRLKFNFFKLAILCFVQVFIFNPAQAGDYTKRTYKLPHFTKVKVATRLNVDIINGKKDFILVKTSKDRFKNLILEVRNNTLIIRNKVNKKRHVFSIFGSDDEAKVYIHIPQIVSVSISGSGSVRIKNMKTREMNVRIEGSGKVLLTGTCRTLDVMIYGSGFFRSENLNCKNIDFSITGSGTAELIGKCKNLDILVKGHVEFEADGLECDKAEVSLNGTGNISLHANKSADIDMNGSGEVIIYGNPPRFGKSIKGDGNVIID